MPKSQPKPEKRKRKQEPDHSKKRRKRLVIVAVVIALVILFDISPLGGTIKFYTTWISCGQKPVVTRGAGYWNEKRPSYSTPPDVNIMPGGKKYYCTPIEAERDGYSANENYSDFPHIRAAGEPNPLWKRLEERLRKN